MKDPESYIQKDSMRYCLDWYDEIIDIIKEAQEEAYNQAIEDCENITPEGWISIVESKKLKIK
mgnify:CR=1 FL=1